MFFISLIGAALLVGRLVHQLPWLTGAAVQAQGRRIRARAHLAAVRSYDQALHFAFWAMATLAVYFTLWGLALVYQVKWFAVALALTLALPTFISVYLLTLIRLTLAEASQRIEELAAWIGQAPVTIKLPDWIKGVWRALANVLIMVPVNAVYLPFSLPTKATGKVVGLVGQALNFSAEQVAHRIANWLANVTVTMFFLAIMALADIWFDLQIMDPWVVGLFAPLGLMVYMIAHELGKEAPKPVRTMINLSGLMLVALVVYQYGSHFAVDDKTAMREWIMIKWDLTPPRVWFFLALGLAVVGWAFRPAKEG